MDKAGKIVNLVYKILVSVTLLCTGLLTLMMSYIMFAPDELPKPFRLVYQDSQSGSGVVMPVVAAPATNPIPTKVVTEAPQLVEPGQGLMINMNTKIINLADPTGRKYIRVTMVLEFYPEPVATEEGKKSEEGSSGTPTPTPQEAKIQTMMPLLDDLVITTLSTKTFEELYTAEGKETLRKELMEAIDKRLPDLHILSVYFTEFVVQ
jgi:flagellar protein FliL